MDPYDDWITEKDMSLPEGITWMDVYKYFELNGTIVSNKKNRKKKNVTVNFNQQALDF